MRQGLPLDGRSPSHLGWLASEPRGAPLSTSPVLELQVHTTTAKLSFLFNVSSGNRTQILLLAKQILYWLSYLPSPPTISLTKKKHFWVRCVSLKLLPQGGLPVKDNSQIIFSLNENWPLSSSENSCLHFSPFHMAFPLHTSPSKQRACHAEYSRSHNPYTPCWKSANEQRCLFDSNLYSTAQVVKSFGLTKMRDHWHSVLHIKLVWGRWNYSQGA